MTALTLLALSLLFDAGIARADVIQECKPWEHVEGSGHSRRCEFGPCSVAWDGSPELGVGLAAAAAGALVLRRRQRSSREEKNAGPRA
jgi:MYXO-CTERM domain-containing protein